MTEFVNSPAPRSGWLAIDRAAAACHLSWRCFRWRSASPGGRAIRPRGSDGNGSLALSHRKRAAYPAVDLGDEDPLYIRHVNKGPPDRRRVSLRWLAGSVLTGIFSTVLVGGALQAAVGIDEDLVVRPVLAGSAALRGPRDIAEKGDRFRPVAESRVTRRVLQISTVTRQDDRDLVRMRPFAHVQTTLAAPVPEEIAARVPSFNPLDMFSGDGEPVEMAASDSIYAAEVDGEVAIKVVDFPLTCLAFDEVAELAAAEVEERVRESAPFLAEGAVELASLPYVDPARFEYASTDPTALSPLTVAITPENVSLVAKSEAGLGDVHLGEKVLEVAQGASLKKLLSGEGASDEEAAGIQSALIANFAFEFRAGQKLRLGLAEDEAGRVRPVRVTLYEGEAHLATVALADTGGYVPAEAPALDDELFAPQEAAPKSTGALPTIHAGLWRTGLSLGIPEPLIENIVRVFSYDVDFQTRLAPADSLEVIYSEDGEAADAEILYASLSLGNVTRTFYRFRAPDDGSVDYFDETGKSAQKFLMRKPMTEGRFTSAFGMRKHPILGRYKLHSGVDWAAPRGTPILAAGSGTVEFAGRKSGLGIHIQLRHANGYQTTYSHMNGIAKGLKAGMSVRQGQVIGYVGSTGLSTGNHLHYEVLVNKRYVDPQKVRVPRGRELSGATLAAFDKERRRIDALLVRDDDSRFAQAAN